MNPAASLLKTSKVFVSLPERELQALALQCSPRPLKRGEVVFLSGEHAESVWLVASGFISLSGSWNQDEAILLDIMPPGALFGLLVGGPDHYTLNASALVDAVAVKIPIAAYRAVVRKHPRAAEAVIELLAERLKDSGRLRSLAGCRAPARVARVLAWLHGKLGARIPMTRALIAQAAGLRRETAVRMLAPLERRGAIHTAKGVVTVRDPRRLSR